MLDDTICNSSAPVVLGADLSANLEYTVVENAAVYKHGISIDARKRGFSQGSRCDTPAVIAYLQRVIAAKHGLCSQDKDAEWDPVAWTTVDSQALLQTVLDVAAALKPALSTDTTPDVAKAVVKAAANGTTWIEQVADLAVAIKGSWEQLPEQEKQVDYAPLELVCAVGLMLVRLYGSVAACATGATQQQATTVLRQLCSKSVQQLLQESIAGHLFIFRWHEQPSAAANLDAVVLCTPVNNSTTTQGTTESISDAQCDSSSASWPQQHAALPRLLLAEFVPAMHRAWTRSFMLPLLPSLADWCNGQEVLLGWSDVCSKAEQLGLPVLITPGSFMLACEALWLFTQSPGSYLPANAATQQAASNAAPMQLMNLWAEFLTRQASRLEQSLSAIPAAKGSASSVRAKGQHQIWAADAIQSGVIIPAACLLFGMLGEALQLLSLQWQEEPAAARAAYIRAAIAESGQPIMARQKKTTALLGKAKPKAAEVACAQVLLMVKQLALMLTELLQLERSACGGPQRDGTVSVTESGSEAVWFSCLWRAFPRGSCQALELLLRCPTPACEATTILLELLLDDMWEALKVLPLLQERDTAKAVTAAVVSSQKLVRLWQAAISDVLLASPTAAAARTKGTAVGAPAAGKGCSSKSSSSKGSRKGGPVQPHLQQKAHVAAMDEGHDASCNEGAVTVPPGWLTAAAEGDVQAALGAGLMLLYRLLDCAQKAYYWRWYSWWESVQQQQLGDCEKHCAAPLSTSSGSSSAVWSSSSSFLSSSSTDSSLDTDDQDDELINAAIEGTSVSSSGSSSAADQFVRMAATGGPTDCAHKAAVTEPVAVGDLWGDGAVLLAFGYTALAAPCFQFVDSVIKRGFGGSPETQRLQQQEATLTLLENVSAGLSANGLILVELYRLGLLPNFAPGSAPVVAVIQSCLHEMLSSALAAANNTRTSPVKAEKAAATAAVRSGPVIPPELAAPIDVYDEYWQALGFEAVDQLRLSKGLAGLALQPVSVGAVGCHNPACCNLSGTSERRLVTLACRACRQVAYCSRSCQAGHWRAEGYCHKAECKDLQEAQQAEWLLPCEDDFGMHFETED